MSLRLAAPGRGFATAILALMCAFSLPAAAQPKGKAGAAKADASGRAERDKSAAASTKGAATRGGGGSDKAGDKAGDKKSKEKTFDFNNLQLNGQLRTPQLLYFLERANEELERASLEKRSFIPHMVRSLEEEAL